MTTDNRPDLPALESVETDATTKLLIYLAVTAFYLLPAGLFLWMGFRHPGHVPPSALIAQLFVLFPLGLVMLGLVLADDYYWRTDDRGLCCRGPLRRRTVRWSQVKSAVVRQNQFSGRNYILTGDGFKIPVRLHVRSKVGGGNDLLAASIWQHLRGLGTANPLELPDVSESFWDTIPDEVPNVVEWKNSSRWAKRFRYVGPAFFFAFALPCLYLIADSDGNPVYLIVGAIGAIFCAGMARMSWRDSMRTALSAVLTDDYIEAEMPSRTVRLQWSDVNVAGADNSFNSGGRSILVRGAKPGDEILIPWGGLEGNSAKLFLAIVRRARTLSKPRATAIPDILRIRTEPPQPIDASAGAVADPVELLPTWYQLLLYAIPFVMMLGGSIALGIAGRGSEPSNGTVAVSFSATGIFGILIMRTYRWEVDDAGVRRHFLWWVKSTRWEEVVSLESAIPRGQLRRCMLIGAQNKVKAIVPPTDLGSKEECRQFLAIVEAYMAEQQSKHPEDQSWKARPWGLDHPA